MFQEKPGQQCRRRRLHKSGRLGEALNGIFANKMLIGVFAESSAWSESSHVVKREASLVYFLFFKIMLVIPSLDFWLLGNQLNTLEPPRSGSAQLSPIIFANIPHMCSTFLQAVVYYFNLYATNENILVVETRILFLVTSFVFQKQLKGVFVN